jgi:hypothetical protein
VEAKLEHQNKSTKRKNECSEGKALGKLKKALFVLLFLLWKKVRILKKEKIFVSF